ncbi:MAG: DUF2235 domain-containing protein, partial [Ferruginibacter sp.]
RGSYEASYSNVARLATTLQLNNSEDNYHFPVYVEGMGTLHNTGDDDDGMRFGAGVRGVIDRVSACIDHVKNRIINASHSNRQIQQLKIDAFGFSRGAAAARYFVHRVLQTDRDFSSLVHQLTNSYSFNISEHKVPFVGLFDTVGSYRAGANPLASIENDTAELHLNCLGLSQIEKVIQLAAGEEHRLNFPLTDIQSAVNAGKGTQIFLPGVHSDVGGGYSNDPDGHGKEEQLIVYDFPSGTGTVNSGPAAARVKQNLISLGWYKDDTMPVEIAPGISVHEIDINPDNQVIVNRTNISNLYSRVPLHIMKEKSQDSGLNFDLTTYPMGRGVMRTFLMEVKSRIENNTDSNLVWMSADYDWLKFLRNHFFHFSAHFESTDILGGLGSVWAMQPQLHITTNDSWSGLGAHWSFYVYTTSRRERRVLEG